MRTLPRPDDWHLHLRDGEILAAVLPFSAAHFGRALIMPNLVPPVVTSAQAVAYRERILANLPQGSGFDPKMALYLTENSNPQDIEAGYRDGVVQAVKLYPAGATTNSESGVGNIGKVMAVLEQMAAVGVPLCVHGEVTDSGVDIFDREAVFIDQVLAPLREKLPELKIVMEHVTTSAGVDFVMSCARNTAATITPHHLLINRNAILAGGIRPHYYCLPVAKRESDRIALRKAATSGDARFFLGTDSAPHPDPMKQSACGCAGIFCAPNAIACCAQVFEDENALMNLEAFVSRNGAHFYGLEPAVSTITIRRHALAQQTTKWISAGSERISVFEPLSPIHWEVTIPAA